MKGTIEIASTNAEGVAKRLKKIEIASSLRNTSCSRIGHSDIQAETFIKRNVKGTANR